MVRNSSAAFRLNLNSAFSPGHFKQFRGEWEKFWWLIDQMVQEPQWCSHEEATAVWICVRVKTAPHVGMWPCFPVVVATTIFTSGHRSPPAFFRLASSIAAACCLRSPRVCLSPSHHNLVTVGKHVGVRATYEVRVHVYEPSVKVKLPSLPS